MASRLSNTTRCQGMFLVTMPVRAYVFLRISGFRRGGGAGGGVNSGIKNSNSGI